MERVSGIGFTRGILLLCLAFSLCGCEQSDIREQERSVYRVWTFRTDGGIESGSGFLVAAPNLVATNYHVIKDESEVLISYLEGGVPQFVKAKVKESNEERDLAILAADTTLPGKVLTLATYGPADGSDVNAIGFPGAADFGIFEKVKSLEEFIDVLRSNVSLHRSSKTYGRISRTFEQKGHLFIQHQAPISGGNSGGPLFDGCGGVIGINTFRSVDEAAIGGAVRAVELADMMKLAGFKPAEQSGACNLANTQRYAPLAIGAMAALISIMAMLIALRKPSVRQSVTRLLSPVGTALVGQRRKPGGTTSFGGTVIGTTDWLGNSDNRIDPPTPAASAVRVRLVPTGGGMPIDLASDRLSRGGIVVGRQRDCDIVVENETVSKRHARLSLDGGGKILVEDLGSGNGTWRDKRRIARESLSNGDQIRFGTAGYNVEVRTAGASPKRGASHRSWMLSGFDTEGKVLQLILEPQYDDAGKKDVETVWTIGRNPARVDRVILDKTISSEHARIRFVPGRGLEICDLGSANGTKIDGKDAGAAFVSLERARTLQLGSLKLTLSQG